MGPGKIAQPVSDRSVGPRRRAAIFGRSDD